MHKLRIIALTIGLGSALASANAGKPTGDLILVQRGDAEAPARLLDYQAVIRGLGTNVRKTLADGRIVVVRPPKNLTWQRYQTQLRASGMFESVEPDTYVTPCATVNDPLFPSQWHLNEISVQRAWDFTLGSSKIVAVVDGGVDLTHPDLMANLVPGYNVLTSTTQLSGGVVSDVRTNGHGTRIAGVAAAVGNNGIGVTGVGPNLKIMPVRVTNDAAQGIATRANLLAGAQWAIDNGATAVNVSYTGVENADVEAMGAYARTQGAFLVWAAGNTGDNWSSFDHANVTVVGGLDTSGNRWVSGTQSSGYGRGVDIYAPCSQIYTTTKGGTYGNAPAGTSFAVPQVAAGLALLKDKYPSSDSNTLEQYLLRRALDKGTIGLDTTWGWGRLNVGKAVENVQRKYDFSLIPIPSGYTNSIARSINDSGVVVGDSAQVSTGLRLPWKWSATSGFSWLPLPPGYSQGTPTKLNSSGQVGLGVWNSGAPQAAVASPDGTATIYSSQGWQTAVALDVSDSGVVVGYQGNWFGYPDQIDSIYWNTPSSPSLGIPSGIWQPGYEYDRLNSVNNFGLSVGTYARTGQGGWGYSFLLNMATEQWVPIPSNWAFRGEAMRIRDSGWIAGWSRETNGYIAAQRCRVAPGPLALTQFEVFPNVTAQAYDISNDGDTVGNLEGESYIFWGLRTGRLRDLLSSALPSNISAVPWAYGINNHGDIVGEATLIASGNPSAAYVARVNDSPSAALSLGQLGESPTYIGSIPPTLSVTFTNEAGVPYANSTVQLNYSGNVGRLDLQRPAGVTGPFRVFMRCNSSVIPNYDGPTFLSTLYPPMNEPALPIDAGFIPRTGPLVGGTPTIIMYPGDVDDSGEIDAADIDTVIANFGLVNGDNDWNGAIDVDGTGEIDAADIDLVIANFGLVGDPEP